MGKRRGHHRFAHMAHSHNPTHNDFEPEIEAKVSQLFKKTFRYKPDLWALPKSNSLFDSDSWEYPPLQNIKLQLNSIKGRLSDIDINEWHSHTQSMNGAGDVIAQIKQHFHPELCTQAWCKFYEIVNSFSIVPWDCENNSGFTSLHICEAPGAFITSLNHYLKSSGYCEHWNWLGNTLNPYYEGNNHNSMIADDRFIFDTYDQWFFGRDNTGDVMCKENLRSLVDLIEKSGEKFCLVTADGSIDCANNPGEQEKLTSQLHFCEAVWALQVLSVGGCFVMKMFTLLENTSICMMYLLCCLFEEVNVFKPATSKAGNSEVYVICQHYKGTEMSMLEILLENVGSDAAEKALFPLSCIPDSFLSQHLSCCNQFIGYQISTIEWNLKSFAEMDEILAKHVEAVRQCCGIRYIERFSVRTIPNGQRIVPFGSGFKLCQNATASKYTNANRVKQRKKHEGSYTQRIQLLGLPWEEKVKQINLFIIEDDDDIGWFQNVFDTPYNGDGWQPVVGKTPRDINNSSFCDISLLCLYNELISEVKQKQEVSREIPVSLVCQLQNYASAGYQCLAMDEELFGPLQKRFILESHSAAVEDCPAEPASHIIFLELIPPVITELSLLQLQISISKLISGLQNLSLKDCLIIALPCPLTRYTAGLVYLIHTAFLKIRFFWDVDGASPLIYMVAENCLPSKLPTILDQLNDILLVQLNLENTTNRVLEPVPLHLLYEPNFYGFLMKNINMFLKTRLNCIIRTEKAKFKMK